MSAVVNRPAHLHSPPSPPILGLGLPPRRDPVKSQATRRGMTGLTQLVSGLGGLSKRVSGLSKRVRCRLILTWLQGWGGHYYNILHL